MFLLYNILLTLLAPVWVPWMLWRAARRKERPNWKERQGIFTVPDRGESRRIWFHAVSVGEFVAAKPILREVRTVLPGYEIVLSVTTSSGHQTARESDEGLFDYLVYFPLDVPRFQLGAIQKVRPDAVAIMETELWMNFLWAAKTFDAQTLLINGRISDRSFPRSMRLRFFYRALLRDVDRCLMQTEMDRKRILALGARTAEVLGNCKFDQALDGLEADVAAWKSELKLTDRPVIVIGSTRGAMEEAFVFDALRRVGLDRIQVVHAPRHLERVDAIAHLVGSNGRRSLHESSPYLILDTYGELSQTYAVADIVIIGGGFDDLGGQNIFQPLAHGKPVLHGIHMQNFRDIAEMADAEGAAIPCRSPEELASAIERLLGDPALRTRMSKAAETLVKENLGASRRYAEAIALAAHQGAEVDAERQRRRLARQAT